MQAQKKYTIQKDTVFLKNNQPLKQLFILLKGTVEIENSYMKNQLTSGSILGIEGLEVGKYLYQYTALEDITVYALDVSGVEGIKNLFLMGNEYKKLTLNFMKNRLKEIIFIHQGLEEKTDKLIQKVQEGYQRYKEICEVYHKKPIQNEQILELHDIAEDIHVDAFLEEYFENLLEIPDDTSVAFFEANEFVTYAHVEKGIYLIKLLHEDCVVMMEKFLSCFKLLFDEGEKNLYSYYYMLGMEIIGAKGDQKDVVAQVEKIMTFMIQTKGFVDSALSIPFAFDRKRMNDVYQTLRVGASSDAEHGQMLTSYSGDQITQAVDLMKNTTAKILEYSGIEKEKAEFFENKLTVYRGLSDFYANDDVTRKLRRDITELFYEIYEKVFFRWYEEKSKDRVLQMFLDFGFADERMFDKETAVMIYHMDLKKTDGRIQVYTMSQWLEEIYEGRREPSKSEFDLDYREYLRELRKKKEITAKEETTYLSDGTRKVQYEIENMFKQNNRITNGKLSAFVPILKQDDFLGDISKSFLSYSKVEEALENLIKIDFSVFHREKVYQDKENKVEKALIMKQVLPDFILMPNAGENGIMWQEISEHRRDSPGRFILPIFLLTDLDAAMTYMVGCFRWELCRTIQGAYWNDIRERSLTSEYSDYVQFYRKNKDISEETRQKIKAQIQKCRNRTREMFAQDYELWIRNECMGSARLNKVARMILSIYCPFSKEYRTKLMAQPMFQEGIAKYEREHQQEIKKIRNMYAQVKTAGGRITPVMEETLQFYEEM